MTETRLTHDSQSLVSRPGAWPTFPRNGTEMKRHASSPTRNLIEPFFNKIKKCRHVAAGN